MRSVGETGSASSQFSGIAGVPRVDEVIARGGVYDYFFFTSIVTTAWFEDTSPSWAT